MSRRTAILCSLVAAMAVLAGGCGGATVLPSSAFPSPDHSVSVPPTSGEPVPTDDVTPGTPPTGTPGPSRPFEVSGAVRLEVGRDVDVRRTFNSCQRAATQHAADTLDPSFDPTGLCQRRAGTSCSGIGAYAGVHARAVVRITDPTGAVVGTGRLKHGVLNRPLTLMGPKPTCVFTFVVASVPGGSAGYGVQVGPARSSFTPAGAVNAMIAIQDD